MSFLTEEQQKVVDYAKQLTGKGMIVIDQVAGSGKTTLLREIAKELDRGQGLYLAYNKAIATESSKKFPKHVDCRTTHSLAYRATVPAIGLKVGFFGTSNIKEKIPHNEKNFLVEDIREFCLSKFLTYEEYAEKYKKTNTVIANKYLTLMAEGKIECTHDFYLKVFHKMLVSKDVHQVGYELIMLDEAGDLNEVTLEIFRALEGRVKVAVGDPHQNIYTFNYTINCFEELEKEGTIFKLSKSFRVPANIAAPVEKFCKKYLNPNMKFSGVAAKGPDTPIETRGYISRTNGGLISKIIELNQERIPYGLVRKASEIFKIPLLIAGLKYQGDIFEPAYKHLQEDVDNWYENHNNIKTTYPQLLGFLRDKYQDDITLSQAINLITKHGKSGIFDAYAEAKKHENSKNHKFLLLTAHQSKGLELDEVTLAPDMNSSIENLLVTLQENPDYCLSSTEKESLNLYYVAATRSLVRLRNAQHLMGL